MTDQAFRDELAAAVEGAVLFDEPLDRHTSIRVGGRADALVFPSSVAALRRVIAHCRRSGVPYTPVGNWTNLLVRDGGYRGVILSMRGLQGAVWERDRQGGALARVEAGVPVAELVRVAARDGFAGLEFCAGIPGSVGGAVVMNAGAYGSEIRDVIEEATLMSGQGELSRRHKSALDFAYRRLNLPEGMIVVEAAFALRPGDPAKIRERVADILTKRGRKHPLEYPNAGSVFKNPAGRPAGRIIEEAGLKGTRIGGAMISEKHGNFIVNTGDARASDILALIDLVQKKVREQTGISLETEVRVIGE